MELIEILKILLLGIVEGITEWLPVSSTGHMVLIEHVFSLNASQDFIDVFLAVVQCGATLAVVLLFFNKLFPFSLKREEGKNQIIVKKDTMTLWYKVIVGCVPAGIIGILFDDFLEEHLYTPAVISATLIIYGIAFILIENRNKNKTLPIQSTAEITYKQAFLIGLFQVLALIPGTSRSGATILGALLLGVARPAGAEFTFFMAAPVMFGASCIRLLKFFLDGGVFTGAELGYLFIGTITAFAVSLFAINFLMNFVKKHDFKIFGWYRIALGVIVIATLVIPTFF